MSRNVLGTILGAVAAYYTGNWSLLGAGAGFDSSANQQDKADANAAENRAFQERMSSTAYQRQVNDMRTAGINPMVAAGAGGASTPSGSTAQAYDLVNPALASALAIARAQAEIDNLEASNDKIRADTTVSTNSAKNLEVQNKLMESQVPKAKNLSRAEEGVFGKIMGYIDRFRQSIFGGGSIQLPK